MKIIIILSAILALTLCQDYCSCQPKDIGDTKGLDPTTKACVDPKVTNCEKAVEDDASKCEECKPDHYPDVFGKATKCTPIPTADKVDGCKYYNDDKKCQDCVSGKGIGNDNKCGTEIANCFTYSGPSTALKCERCKPKYKLKADKTACESDEVDKCANYDPTTPTAPKCHACEQGYYPSSNKCTKNTTVDKCKIYNPTKDACLSCESGYLASSDGKKCDKLTVEKCIHSNSGLDKCDFCDGVAPTADKKKCTEAVTADSNCMGFGVDKKCGSCKVGYGMDGNGKCVNKCPTNSALGGGSNSQIIAFSILLIALVAIIL